MSTATANASRTTDAIILGAVEGYRRVMDTGASCTGIRAAESAWDSMPPSGRARIARYLNSIGFTKDAPPRERFVLFVVACVHGVDASFPEPRPARTRPTLTLAIGLRSYRVDLQWWTPADDHVILLEDATTGQVTRVLDMQNRGKTGEARCSCSPGKASARCRHVKALVEVSLLPRWTRTEGE